MTYLLGFALLFNETSILRQLFVRSLYYVVIQFYTKINKSLSLAFLVSKYAIDRKVIAGFNSLDVCRAALHQNTKPIEYSKFICLNVATKDQKKGKCIE